MYPIGIWPYEGGPQGNNIDTCNNSLVSKTQKSPGTCITIRHGNHYCV